MNDITVVTQDPRFGGGALAQTAAFLHAATELGHTAAVLHPRFVPVVDSLALLVESRRLARPLRDARQTWVVAAAVPYGDAAVRAGRPYAAWVGDVPRRGMGGAAAGADACPPARRSKRMRPCSAGSSAASFEARSASTPRARAPALRSPRRPGSMPTRIGILPIPVDTERFAPGGRTTSGWPASSGRRSSSSAAPTTRARTSRLLLDAWPHVRARFPDARLRLVGRPPDAAASRWRRGRRRGSHPSRTSCGEPTLRPPLAPGGLRDRRRRGARLRRPGARDAVRRPGGARFAASGGGVGAARLRARDACRCGRRRTRRLRSRLARAARPRPHVRRSRALAGASPREARSAFAELDVPDVAVVIGNYQGERLLPDCLASLEAQTLRPSEVSSSTASSTDASVEVAERLGARVLRRENRGLGHLYNEGARTPSAPSSCCSSTTTSLSTSRCIELLAAELGARSVALRRRPASGRLGGHARREGAHDALARPARARVHPRAPPRRPRAERRRSFRPSAPTAPRCSSAASSCSSSADSTRLSSWSGRTSTSAGAPGCAGTAASTCPTAWLRHRVGAATSPGDLTRRLASSHHNLMRFALKCLPRRRRRARARRRAAAPSGAPAPDRSRACSQSRGSCPRSSASAARSRRRRAHLDWLLAGMPA